MFSHERHGKWISIMKKMVMDNLWIKQLHIYNFSAKLLNVWQLKNSIIAQLTLLTTSHQCQLWTNLKTKHFHIVTLFKEKLLVYLFCFVSVKLYLNRFSQNFYSSDRTTKRCLSIFIYCLVHSLLSPSLAFNWTLISKIYS